MGKFYRSGRKGGQNVNKVETAVIKTFSFGESIVECQQSRTQGENGEISLNNAEEPFVCKRNCVKEKKQNMQRMQARKNMMGKPDKELCFPSL